MIESVGVRAEKLLVKGNTQVAGKSSGIKLRQLTGSENASDLSQNPLRDDFAATCMVESSHLTQVKHHIEVQRSSGTLEPNALAMMQLWVTTHQNDDEASETRTVVQLFKVTGQAQSAGGVVNLRLPVRIG